MWLVYWLIYCNLYAVSADHLAIFDLILMQKKDERWNLDGRQT